MNVLFNTLNHIEDPTISLCSPGCVRTVINSYDDTDIYIPSGNTYTQEYTLSRSWGELKDYSNLNVKLNFNAQWELSFDYFSDLTKPEEYIFAGTQSTNTSLFEMITNRMYLYVKGYGFFIIKSVNTVEEENLVKKSISAISCDEELTNYENPQIDDGSYLLYSDNGDETTVLSIIKDSLGYWSIGYVDQDLKGEYRYFENVADKSIYEFLWKDIQDAYGCIIVPNYEDRVLDFYTQANFLKVFNTSIHIAKSNLLNSVGISSEASDMYSAVKASGDNDLTVSWVNPMGNDILYDFSSFYNLMSPLLSDCMRAWSAEIDSLIGTSENWGSYVIASKDYYNAMTTRINAQADRDAKKDAYEYAKQSYLNFKNSGKGDLSQDNFDKLLKDAKKKKDNAKAAYDASKTPLANAKEEEAQKKAIVDSYSNGVQFKAYIETYLIRVGKPVEEAEELYQELKNYIYVCEYKDKHLIWLDSMTWTEVLNQAIKLADNAKAKLGLVSSGIRKFTIDSNDFIFNKDFKLYTKQLAAGCVVHCETSDGFVEDLQCTDISVDYESKKLSLGFADKRSKYDIKTIYDDVLGGISKSLADISSIQEDLKTQQDKVKEQSRVLEAISNIPDPLDDADGVIAIGNVTDKTETSGAFTGLGGSPIIDKSLVLDWVSTTYYRKSGSQYEAISKSTYESSHNSEIYYFDSYSTNSYYPVFDWDNTTYYILSGGTYSSISKSSYESNQSRDIYSNQPVDYRFKIKKNTVNLANFYVWKSEANANSLALRSHKFNYNDGTGHVSRLAMFSSEAGEEDSAHNAITMSSYTDSSESALVDGKRDFRLTYKGKVYVKDGTYTNWSQASDRNVKKDIEEICNNEKYDKFFNSLKPVRYKYKDGDDKYRIGFIAQEVKESLDSANLTEEEFGGYVDEKVLDEDTDARYKLNYIEFISLCVSQIQELKKEVKDLKSKLDFLEKEGGKNNGSAN